jgi:hypothetical protein
VRAQPSHNPRLAGRGDTLQETKVGAARLRDGVWVGATAQALTPMHTTTPQMTPPGRPTSRAPCFTAPASVPQVHAKCLRSLPLVREYFRSYRKKKKVRWRLVARA